MTDIIATPISAASRRMRRHRQRRRHGFRCVRIELHETQIDELIRKGLLKSETRNDPRALRSGLHALLDEVLA
jgi:hypothetical protein